MMLFTSDSGLRLVVAILLTLGSKESRSESFPDKPINIIVYMAPGGLIDATTRRFVEVAKKYTDATFVVQNKVGAGGIVAMQHVLAKPADGYTLMACTKSNLSKIVASKCEDLLPRFYWAAILMRDPECVITLSDTELSDWNSLIDDARRKSGDQIWVGPARGGLDHVMALKTWERVKISAKWIPYKSGGEAKAALLGKQGVAYVGNPRDASGNPKFQIAAVSAPERLIQFPSTPTFQELGVAGLDNEVMWRGFALKAGCSQAVRSWYGNLFRNVTNDPEWREYWQKDGIEIVYLDEPEFRRIVEENRDEFVTYLARLDIINKDDSRFASWLMGDSGGRLLTLCAMVMAIIVSYAVSRSTRRSFGATLIPVTLAALAVVILVQSIGLSNKEAAGPGMIPVMLAICMLGLVMILVLRRRAVDAADRPDSKKFFVVTLLVVVGYLIMTHSFGYLVATGLFLSLSIYSLGVTNKRLIGFVTISWLLISYVVFVKLLFVPLPQGTVWQTLY